MALILDQLRMDHRDMRLLLQIFEEQAELYRRGETPDFDLMQEIIDYALHYPSLVHHPREDLLLQRLSMRDPEAGSVVGDLIQEHADLAKLIQRLAAALHNVAHDAELPREWFEKLLHDYVDKTRRHMEREEQTFFPRLTASLKDSDWADLDGRVAVGKDPLFGSVIEQHYHRLHRSILRAGT